MQQCAEAEQSFAREHERQQEACCAVGGEHPPSTRLGREEESRAYEHGREKVRGEAFYGAQAYAVEQGEGRRRSAESRRPERGDELCIPRCSRHLNMRLMTDEGDAAVE